MRAYRPRADEVRTPAEPPEGDSARVARVPLARRQPSPLSMSTHTSLALRALLAVILASIPAVAHAQADSGQRSGQHDFDWEIGTWKTQLKRLQNPLSGSDTWVEYQGTTVVTKVWDGRANLVELDVTGPSGSIEALSLRLYNPDARQWSLNFSSSRTGTFSPPSIGEFKDGRGEFMSQEYYNGRAILVRFIVTPITPDSAHFVQAYSEDGGKTWEDNWIATDTRMPSAQ